MSSRREGDGCWSKRDGKGEGGEAREMDSGAARGCAVRAAVRAVSEGGWGQQGGLL